MSAAAAAIGKAAALILGDERGRKALGWILVAVLAPLILLIAIVCSLGRGSADHNNTAVKASFYGSAFTEQIPAEYKEHITEMQSAFGTLDGIVASVNEETEDDALDATRVKAVFYALCFGEDAPTRRAANDFVNCFYTVETRTRTVEVYDPATGTTSTETEEYTVNVPLSPSAAYANLAMRLGREVTEDDRHNVDHIYTMVAGQVGGYADSSELGGYNRVVSYDTALDVPLRHPERKNAEDLVIYAKYAWEHGWGYIWGSFGSVVTPAFLDAKAAQYPVGVGDQRELIEQLWMGKRTTDCCGLIKSYGWYNPETQSIVYGSNGMPDLNANNMFYNASESGPIDTIPEIPGLGVWLDGHIGVYIGNGEVIEAAGTGIGVIRTQLARRNFTHWLKIAYIDYTERTTMSSLGMEQQVK